MQVEEGEKCEREGGGCSSERLFISRCIVMLLCSLKHRKDS
jgi:hypothetical protein